MMRSRILALAAISATVVLGVAAHGKAMIRRIGGGGGAGGTVNLPYTSSDNSGNMWYVYNDGAIRQQSGQPIYSQGGMITVDGNGFNTQNNMATLDPSTGELVLENPQVGTVGVTRRIFFDKDNGMVRYIDVLHNATNQPKSVSVVMSTNLNYGVQQSQIVPDPKKKDQNLAWVAMTGAGKAAVDVYAGKGTKNAPSIQFQNGNNMVQASLTVNIPAGKDAAVMHLHMISANVETGVKFVNDIKESKLLHDIPSALRREIVNFSAGQGWIGDVEILRGDVFDVVELRGGDQLKGTLKETSYKLNTFYGPVELQVDRVIALINVGQFRPHQLVVTADGEIFGGRLAKETMDIALSSGQNIQVPLAQVARMGYRKRPNEPEEWTFDKPMVMMRTGDRVGVQMPAAAVEVATRYGVLKLEPQSVAAVVFQSEDNGVHEIYLTDGSKFAGLVSADAFEMKLSGAGPDQTVKFPTSSILRLQLAGKVEDPDEASPTLTLINQDELVGSITGQLKLDTAFDTITVDGPQVRHIDRGKEGAAGDVQVTLWDGTTVSGQVQGQDVKCHLVSGAEVDVPVTLVQEYNQPLPQPSPEMVKQIEAAVTSLSADDWHERDRAEATLVGMGPSVGGVLKQLREKQGPEAQQRIDAILKKLASQKPAPAPHAAAPSGDAPIQPQFLRNHLDVAVPNAYLAPAN